MIHKARVTAIVPERAWAKEVQRLREKPGEDPRRLLMCAGGEVTIQSSEGRVLDPYSELLYEFVRYDASTDKIIISACVDVSKLRRVFNALFPERREDEAFGESRFFLITSSGGGDAWLLLPDGKEAHNKHGGQATPKFLAKLLREARD
jgi:hypothetical protein